MGWGGGGGGGGGSNILKMHLPKIDDEFLKGRKLFIFIMIQAVDTQWHPLAYF